MNTEEFKTGDLKALFYSGVVAEIQSRYSPNDLSGTSLDGEKVSFTEQKEIPEDVKNAVLALNEAPDLSKDGLQAMKENIEIVESFIENNPGSSQGSEFKGFAYVEKDEGYQQHSMLDQYTH